MNGSLITGACYLIASWLIGVGLYGLVRNRNLIGIAICLIVVQSSTYLFLIAVGYRYARVPPVAVGNLAGLPKVDPIVQALTLTDIVVEATFTTLLLAFILQTYRRFGTVDPNELRALED